MITIIVALTITSIILAIKVQTITKLKNEFENKWKSAEKWKEKHEAEIAELKNAIELHTEQTKCLKCNCCRRDIEGNIFQCEADKIWCDDCKTKQYQHSFARSRPLFRRNIFAEKVRQLRQEFREELCCPVCLEELKNGEIFQCSDGHLICPGCKPKVLSCPICRRNPPNWTQNRYAEKFRKLYL